MARIPFLPARETRRIAVFRALPLGDMLCALPALRALRGGFADAEITLVGPPWAHSLASRLDTVHRFMAFPGYPGLARSTPVLEALPDFLARVQAQRFDLVLQLHGGGDVTNPLVTAFGARQVAAFVQEGSFRPSDTLSVAWPQQGHEIERCLALTDHLGLARDGLDIELPLTLGDREAAAALAGNRPYVVVHPGARQPSRRWPVRRFAAVADALSEQGYTVLATGSDAETPLVDELLATMTQPAHNLAGRTGLFELAALIEGAQLLVSNDCGVSHLAAATGTRSVIVMAAGDVERWAPLDRKRHRALCGTSDEGGGHTLGVDEVIAVATELLYDDDEPVNHDAEAAAAAP